MKKSIGSRVFDGFNIALFCVLIIVMFFPLYNVVITSFLTQGEFNSRPIILWPRNPTLDAYRFILSDDEIVRAFFNTVFITVAGTALSMFFTLMLSYGLSKKYLPGQQFFIVLILLTMFFSGGLIPFYLLVKSLGLVDNIMVNILPVLINAWNFIIIKSFFAQLPQELEESAIIDGAGYFRVFFFLALPLSLPVVATFSLYYGVDYWNTWWNSMLFINKQNMHPLQLLLRRMIVDNEFFYGMEASYSDAKTKYSIYSESIRMATCTLTIIPIICVYPFLQKYFVKGVILGAIKG